MMSMILMVSVISGCSNDNKEKASIDKQPAETEKNSSEGSSKVEAEKDKEIVELTWYIFQGSKMQDEDLVWDAINAYLEKEMGLRVNQKILTWDDYKAKLPLSIASGEPFDICFTASWLNEYIPNVAKGAFKPLNDLLDTHGQALKETIPEKLWNGVRVDGEVYGIPCYKEMGHQWGYFLNKSMVEKYNMDFTGFNHWSDIEPYLQIIKENEPGILPLGIVNNTPPWFMEKTIDKVSGSDSIPGVVYSDTTDYSVINEFATDQFKAYVTKMHQWFKKGYISKSVATTSDTGPEVKAQKVFAGLVSYAPYAENWFKQSNGYEVVFVPVGKPVLATRDCQGGLHAINNNSKHPEEAMALLNRVNTDPVLRNMLNYGIEGQHYVRVNDTQVEAAEGIDSTAHPYNYGYGWIFGNVFLSYVDTTFPVDLWDTFRAYNDSSEPAPSLGFNFDPTPVSTEIAVINNVWSQYAIPLWTGAVDPEKYLPEFLDRLEQAGIQRILDEQQKQLDAWLKVK